MKPIHKFNGGNGATICNICRKTISVGFSDELFCKQHKKQIMIGLILIISVLILGIPTIYESIKIILKK